MGLFQEFINNNRGKRGENKIATKLSIIDFFGYHGKSLKNLYIPRKHGGTSEIDLVFITVKGIFVIESKNYSGFIFGHEQNRNWTSTLYAGKYSWKKSNKFHFYNPIWQNQAHIKTLKEYCGDVRTFSIIVFGNNCDIKDVTWTTPGTYICYTKSLNKCIKSIWDAVPDIYSPQQVQEMYNILFPLTNMDGQIKNQHVQDIKQRSTSDICPRCGGTLVIRVAQHGAYQGSQFYGCSNYPKCRFIRNIS